MIEINKTTIGLAAGDVLNIEKKHSSNQESCFTGVAGTLFLGYCIYFDKKRRSDPEYKKKVRERKFVSLIF